MTVPAPVRLIRIRRRFLIAIALGLIPTFWLQIGIGWTLVAVIPWAMGLLMLAASDLEYHRLRKSVTYITGLMTAAALVVAAAASDSWARFGVAGLCAISASGVFGLIWLAFPRSLGFGDVRLVALASLMLGWFDPMLAIFGLLAGQIGCLVAVVVLGASRRANRKTEVPLGTFLALTSIAVVITLGR